MAILVAVSAVSAEAEPPRHVRLRSRDAKDDRPFSDAVRVGQTLYLAGRIGLDPATQKPPAEVRNVMDQIKAVLA
jgi:enamine deaminase RidA (YjgF/YER057c/UK114 family)